MTLLREVESLASQQEPPTTQRLGLQEEVQRYESELIREALQRTRGNQRRAAKLLGVKVTTLNCKIKRLGLRQRLHRIYRI
jgi:DNA-binding NtrC family response regulator